MARSAQLEFVEMLGAGGGEMAGVLVELIDAMQDVVFFAKDLMGRYVLVNQTLVKRLGRGCKQEILGRRVDELFPASFGESFRKQDEEVLKTGARIEDRLELHLYGRRAAGWCRTFKLPLEKHGRRIGLMGFSKDLHRPESDRTPAGVVQALGHLRGHLHRRVSIAELAEVANMAPRSFERAVQDLFQLSAGDLVIQARIDQACRLLRESELPISHIALDCGYGEHSSFSRQFRTRVGVTPRQFRAMGQA